jgi:hypothetical protein
MNTGVRELIGFVIELKVVHLKKKAIQFLVPEVRLGHLRHLSALQLV